MAFALLWNKKYWKQRCLNVLVTVWQLLLWKKSQSLLSKEENTAVRICSSGHLGPCATTTKNVEHEQRGASRGWKERKALIVGKPLRRRYLGVYIPWVIKKVYRVFANMSVSHQWPSHCWELGNWSCHHLRPGFHCLSFVFEYRGHFAPGIIPLHIRLTSQVWIVYSCSFVSLAMLPQVSTVSCVSINITPTS